MDAYDFLLDLFPLTAQVGDEYPVLAQQLQLCALGMLEDACEAQRLELLLRLSCDLGTVDADVLRYLQKSLHAIARQAGRRPSSA